MRVLVSCTPGLGHFHPVVPLAEGLRSAGHEVAFASTASFASTIEATGMLESFLFGVADPALLSADAVRDALTKLLGDPSYRQRAREVGRTIDALPPLAVAVERLVALARASS